jgi:hypothetical protein
MAGLPYSSGQLPNGLSQNSKKHFQRLVVLIVFCYFYYRPNVSILFATVGKARGTLAVITFSLIVSVPFLSLQVKKLNCYLSFIFLLAY